VHGPAVGVEHRASVEAGPQLLDGLVAVHVFQGEAYGPRLFHVFFVVVQVVGVQDGEAVAIQLQVAVHARQLGEAAHVLHAAHGQDVA